MAPAAPPFLREPQAGLAALMLGKSGEPTWDLEPDGPTSRSRLCYSPGGLYIQAVTIPLLFSLGGNTNICIAPGCREDVCFACLPNGSDCPFSFSKLSHPTPHLQGLGCLPSPSLPPSGESWMATSQQKEGHLLIKIKNDHTGEQLVESGNRPSAQQEGRRLSVSGC